MKKFLAMILVMAMAVAAKAGVIAAVDSNSVNADLKSYGYPVSTDNGWSGKWVTDAKVASAVLSVSAELSVPGSPANNQFSAQGWDAGGQYFSMTVILAQGYEFGSDIELIYGGLRASSTGPNSGTTAIIVDGRESVIDSYSLSTSYLNRVNDIGSLVAGASAIEIRWYGAGATSATGTHRIGDYYLDGVYTDTGLYGTVNAVPEPTTLVLLSGCAMYLARRRK